MQGKAKNYIPSREFLEHERKYFLFQILWSFFKPIVLGWGGLLLLYLLAKTFI